MAHQSPRRQIFFVQLDRSLKVNDCFVMVASQTIVVANGAASFRSIFIICEQIECQAGEFSVVFFYVKNVAIKV